MDELALDRCFWRELSSASYFLFWILRKTKFSASDLRLVTDEKWHQRWYRDPQTNKDSETDILLLFHDASSDQRVALHIENKPSHGKWAPHQAENYRKRAENRKAAWNYVDYQTALLAPLSFMKAHPVEAAHFDILLTYEDVGRFVPEFAIHAAAIDKPFRAEGRSLRARG